VGLLVSALGVFYSGLMFLEVAPGPLSIRFWDGGREAMTTAAVLDIACGSVIFYLAIQVLLGNEVKRLARDALIVCAVAVFSDWIGGLYGLSAVLGLVCSYLILKEPGWRTL
jgi:DNA integrity scanning protein DisA with diadenylate cyclase activity